jgi:hypothetical protein
MSVNPNDVLKRLIERNPDTNRDELCRAFTEGARDDPKLLEAVLKDVADTLYPIAKKISDGERLTKTEQAVWKFFGGERLTKREQTLVDDYAKQRHAKT